MGQKRIETVKLDGKLPRLVYGLKGISAIFNVSQSTALKMSKGVISGACSKRGRIILVDTRKALELFGVPNPDDFIK